MRRFLPVLLLFSFFSLNARTLFWIGGSGNWNDPAHWSLSSGGPAAGIRPGIGDDLIFDNASAQTMAAIDILGTAQAHSVSFLNNQHLLYLQGGSSARLMLDGNFPPQCQCQYRQPESPPSNWAVPEQSPST